MATEVFDDPNAFMSENYFVDGEQRLQIIGMTRDMQLLLVVFVDLTAQEQIIYRIISARKADAFEGSIYEDQIST